MPDEQNERPTQSGTAGHGNSGSGRLVRTAARARQVASTLQGEEVFAEVNFSEEHIFRPQLLCKVKCWKTKTASLNGTATTAKNLVVSLSSWL